MMRNKDKIKVLKSEIKHTQLDSDRPHYYGQIKSISSINDVAYLSRGSVYYINDNPKDPKVPAHPYLVLQDTYLDKIGIINVFGITSTPSSINMVPIVMKGSIGYIDPHQPYQFKVDYFFSRNSKYIARVVNSKVMELVANLYGLHLGMDLKKSREEIISDYIKYVEEFKERTKDLKPYKHKHLEENPYSTNIVFKTSFNIEERGDSNGDTEYICVLSDDEYSNEEYDNDVVTDDERDVIKIDVNDKTILSIISSMEQANSCKTRLPRNVDHLSKPEVVVFLTYVKMNGISAASLLYNCSANTINRKYIALLEKYNVVYAQ